MIEGSVNRVLGFFWGTFVLTDSEEERPLQHMTFFPETFKMFWNSAGTWKHVHFSLLLGLPSILKSFQWEDCYIPLGCSTFQPPLTWVSPWASSTLNSSQGQQFCIFAAHFRHSQLCPANACSRLCSQVQVLSLS